MPSTSWYRAGHAPEVRLCCESLPMPSPSPSPSRIPRLAAWTRSSKATTARAWMKLNTARMKSCALFAPALWLAPARKPNLYLPRPLAVSYPTGITSPRLLKELPAICAGPPCAGQTVSMPYSNNSPGCACRLLPGNRWCCHPALVTIHLSCSMS